MLALLAPLAAKALPIKGAVRVGAQVGARAIERYQAHSAFTLAPIAEARVPLHDAENARVIAYRPHDGGVEHLAIIIGEPDPGRRQQGRIGHVQLAREDQQDQRGKQDRVEAFE